MVCLLLSAAGIHVTLQAKVLSSIIAAWADITHRVQDPLASPNTGYGLDSLETVRGMVQNFNAGYLWMFLNCGASAAYVRTIWFRCYTRNTC